MKRCKNYINGAWTESVSVIMGTFVIVQILLKLCLKRQILRLRRQHICISAGIGGQHAGGRGPGGGRGPYLVL